MSMARAEDRDVLPHGIGDSVERLVGQTGGVLQAVTGQRTTRAPAPATSASTSASVATQATSSVGR